MKTMFKYGQKAEYLLFFFKQKILKVHDSKMSRTFITRALVFIVIIVLILSACQALARKRKSSAYSLEVDRSEVRQNVLKLSRFPFSNTHKMESKNR